MKSEWSSESKDLTHLYIYNQLKRMDKINEKKWKFVAIFSSLCLGLTLMLLAYTINLPKTVPLVIAVNDFGEAKYMGPANKLNYSGMRVPQVAIEYQIRKFIANKYSSKRCCSSECSLRLRRSGKRQKNRAGVCV